ncbi:MAG: glycoside hydrolase family 2 protein, partial [Saprospiraceae bacterium]
MLKRFACLAFVLAAMPIHTQTLHVPERLAIKDNWTFRQAHKGTWLPVSIPVSAHTALLKHGLIEDPYYRDNESKLQWIEQEDWEFQTTFEVTETMLQFRHVEMSLKGLDTYAQVYLNDSLVAETDNMFRAWQVDVKKYLHKGVNTLHVYFESPVQKAKTEWETLGYELPGGIRTMTRKAQFHYGWDWGPRLVGCGIQHAPEMVMWNDMLIENVYVTPRELTDARARMVVHVRYNTDYEGKVTLITRNGKAKIIEDRYVYAGIHEDSMTFDIDNPRLWWCRGMGEPYLYDIHFEIRAGVKTIESADLRFGLRTIELVNEPDGDGRTFYFKLNGKPVFAKGANYIPQDLFQDRVTPAQYRKLIDAAADANMNMLRVWGGGIYEDDLFYQLCDAKGILVWQDFMYACAMYPGNGGFLKTASKEADQQIERLRQPPCIALWCGNNENNEAWNNWGWQM